MNYHKRIKMEKARIKAKWSTTNKPNDYGNPGKKIVGNPIPYDRLPGNNGNFKFFSQSELYLVTPCYCPRCTDFWQKEYGITIGQIDLGPNQLLVELTSKEKVLVYDFEPRGTAKVPRAKGLMQILMALMADKKSAWSNKPFMFLGRLVRPGHWQVEHFDRFTRIEQQKLKPKNAKTIKTEGSLYDNKLDFESKAQMNAEFEKRFSS